MLELVLLDEGYRVLGAGDGQQALGMLESARPDLILLDWMMPDLDGPTFAAELQRRDLRPTIPLLVITASGDVEQKAASIGAEEALAKPFDLAALLDAVAQLIAGR